MVLRAVVTFIAFLLAGCSSSPDYQRPALPVPQTWPIQPSINSDSPVETNVHWRKYFTDPRLQALISAALSSNRDLRIAAARVEEARAQYGLARASRLPTLGLTGSGSIAGLPSDLSGTGQGATSERYDLSLSMNAFELDFWHRLAGLSEAARFSFLSTEESRRAVHLSLVADVAGAYFAQIQMSELAAFARLDLDSRELALSVIAKGRDLGAADNFQYQQALGLLEYAKANLDGIEHQKNVATNRLNFLLGSTQENLPEGRGLDQQGLEMSLAPGLPGEVLLRRPDVVGAEQRLLSANANVGAARAAFFPRILLTAGLGVASQGLAGLFSGGAWSFQPAISLPIFDGGKLSSSVEIAEARTVIAVAEYEKTIQGAFREVADLLSQRETLNKQMRSATLSATAQEQRLKALNARYGAGLIGSLELLEGERELNGARQNVNMIRRSQLDAATQLYKALGGGE